MLRHFELRFLSVPGAVRDSTQIHRVPAHLNRINHGGDYCVPFRFFLSSSSFLRWSSIFCKKSLNLATWSALKNARNLFASLLTHLFTLHIFLIVNRGELAVHL